MREGIASLSILSLMTATSGCFYVEGAGGAHLARGGVEGGGWNAGVNVGTFYDIDDTPVRLSTAGEAHLLSTDAADGHLYTLAGGVNVRGDVLLTGGRDVRMAAILSGAYGGGNLVFRPPGGDDYKGTTRTLSSFVGLAAVIGRFTLGAGPRVIHALNDFVGDTTTFAAEGRVGYWVDLTRIGLKFEPTEAPPAADTAGESAPPPAADTSSGSKPIEARPDNHGWHVRQQNEWNRKWK